MAGGLSNEEKSLISYVLNDVYAEKGITEECGSLYTGEVTFNKETMEMEHGGVKKKCPHSQISTGFLKRGLKTVIAP